MNNRENTIRIAVRKYDPFESALQKIWEDWSRERGYNLQLQAVPMELHELHDAILVREGMKKGDWDIAHLCTDWITEAALSGSAEDLLPYLRQNPPEDYPHGWSASLLELQRYEDRVLGLPFHDGPECLIYRRDLFDDPVQRAAYRQRFGTELHPPRTWEEFGQIAKFFYRPGQSLYGTVLAGYPDGHNAVFDFCLQLWSRGGELLNKSGEVDINTEAAREGLDFYRRLMKDTGAVHPGSTGFESVRAGEAFAAGDAAMMVNWFGFAAACEQGSAVKGKVGVAPVPRGPVGEGVSLNVYWLYALAAGSRHKAAAYDFIRFATSRRNDRLLTLEGGIGCRLSTWTDPEINALIPYYHKLEELHQTARTLPALPGWAEIAGIIDAAVQEAIAGDASVEEILNKAQQKIARLAAAAAPSPAASPAASSVPGIPGIPGTHGISGVHGIPGIKELHYQPELPLRPASIIIIGAGGIVGDAHLPAYKKAGFEVFGIVNRTLDKAKKLAADYAVPYVFETVEEAMAAAPANAVYDLALMPAQYPDVLAKLPDGAAVLIQKPMGDNLEQAREIRAICERKQLIAAVNFQLRYAPFVMAARQLMDSGLIGELYDMEVRLTTFTPWEIFPHVAAHPRLEILYHSIHYIDLVRSFLGNPAGVAARTFRHPLKPFASTRSTILMDYGDTVRAVVNTNHDHDFGPRNQESFIKWEGTRGAIKAKMGLLLDYPRGVPDVFEYCITGAAEAPAEASGPTAAEGAREPEWKQVQLEGSWFPDAFVGTMSDLMRYAEGSIRALPTGIDDVIYTMEAVEKAYESD